MCCVDCSHKWCRRVDGVSNNHTKVLKGFCLASLGTIERGYKRRVAQTKDLQWSRLNPTLYSLCFAGKAKRNVACTHCISDNHTSDNCPDNPTRPLFPWQSISAVGDVGNTVPFHPTKRGVCFHYNKKEGQRCTFRQCIYQHVCSVCKGRHPRSANGAGESTVWSERVASKCNRQD